MSKFAVITQDGIGKIDSNSPVKGLFTDAIDTCFVLVFSNKETNNYSLIHDTGRISEETIGKVFEEINPKEVRVVFKSNPTDWTYFNRISQICEPVVVTWFTAMSMTIDRVGEVRTYNNKNKIPGSLLWLPDMITFPNVAILPLETTFRYYWGYAQNLVLDTVAGDCQFDGERFPNQIEFDKEYVKWSLNAIRAQVKTHVLEGVYNQNHVDMFDHLCILLSVDCPVSPAVLQTAQSTIYNNLFPSVLLKQEVTQS